MFTTLTVTLIVVVVGRVQTTTTGEENIYSMVRSAYFHLIVLLHLDSNFHFIALRTTVIADDLLLLKILTFIYQSNLAVTHCKCYTSRLLPCLIFYFYTFKNHDHHRILHK